jgi:hypothetical protein
MTPARDGFQGCVAVCPSCQCRAFLEKNVVFVMFNLPKPVQMTYCYLWFFWSGRKDGHKAATGRTGR